MMRTFAETGPMWLLGWLVRVLLLLLAPLYFLFRFAADALANLDQWAVRAIQKFPSQKPSDSKTAVPPNVQKKAS
jgi:hypothetical protein